MQTLVEYVQQTLLREAIAVKMYWYTSYVGAYFKLAGVMT